MAGAAGGGEPGAAFAGPYCSDGVVPGAGLLLPYFSDGIAPNSEGFQTAPEPDRSGDLRSLGPVIGVSVLPAASLVPGTAP